MKDSNIESESKRIMSDIKPNNANEVMNTYSLKKNTYLKKSLSK